MPLLIVMAVLANGFLCVLLTMREGRLDTVRTVLIAQAFGMGLLWCVILAGASGLTYGFTSKDACERQVVGHVLSCTPVIVMGELPTNRP